MRILQNCPEERKIEDFWAIVKGVLRKTGGQTNNKKNFQKKWINATNMVKKEKICKMMASTRYKV